METRRTQRTPGVAAVAILVLTCRALAGAATLETITVSPPVLELRPCEAATLEITGHYDDGTTRDLSQDPGLAYDFELGNAVQNGPGVVVMLGSLDDSLRLELDGVESTPVSLLIVDPQDLSRCPVVIETTTTTTSLPSTTSTSSSTTTTTTTAPTSTTVATTPPTTTTSTTQPEPPDFACSSCVHDRVQHRFRIENHLIFNTEQIIEDGCLATEFPQPFFQVAADGTQTSVFDVTQVVEGSCQTTLTDPNPMLLDELFQPIANPDPDFFGEVTPIDRRAAFVRFNYRHPTMPPDDGDKFRVVRIGIFYIDRRNPGAGERLFRVLEIRVHRPPVLMVHGLWSDAGAFADMDQTLASSNYEPYQLYRLDYRNTNDSHFDVNYPQVSGGLDAVIQQSADAGLAAGKADVVTHSMGGVISRLYVQSPDYQHEVRRIVTSNTPHAGSQMANLLLDRAFDPQGLLCSMLSQAMSSPSVPNRGCLNGAVEDMQVASPATVIDLNQGTHPTELGVHAIATFFDLAGATDLSSIPVTKETVGPLIVAQVLRGCGLSLIDTIFGFDDSDLIVSVTSQAGGLGGTLTSLFPDQIHMGATANPGVIQEVRNLLNEPKDSNDFTDAGYSPPQLGYNSPSLCPLLLRARALNAITSAAASGVTIDSPAPGTTLSPGASFTVEVSGGPEIATILVVLSQPGGAAAIREVSGSSARFDLQVPEAAVGAQNLLAAGLDAGGRLVAVSPTTNLDVRVPAPLDGVAVYPPVVYLRPCATASLQITGQYEDGVARDLTEQPGLDFRFASGNAARNGANGVVLNQPEGDTLTVTFDGVESAPIPIRVLGPTDLRLCGGQPTTTTTIASTTTTTTVSTTTTTSSTIPSETTTTTTSTTAPSSSTTSTLPPACLQSGDCDDGDACTDDLCTPGGCEHTTLSGVVGAQCLLSAALADPLCEAGTIDPKLEQFVTAKLARALELLQKATEATKPKRQRKLLSSAQRVLAKIAHRKPGTTTQGCLDAIATRVDAVLAALL